jgi:hypothetical protein
MRERDKMLAATMLKDRIAETLLELAEHFGQEVGLGRIIIQRLAAPQLGEPPVWLLLP